MRVLVTGGAGLIGSAVVKNLNDNGITDIVIVDRLRDKDKWKNLLGLKYKQYIEVEDWLASDWYVHDNRFDAIIHLGACSSTTQKDASYLAKNNLWFSTNLCQYAIKSNIRFVYASSAATYGLGISHMSDNGPLETLEPLNAYGWSKHAFDLWALKEGISDKIVGLKYFNVFGPREGHKGEMRSIVLRGYEEIKTTNHMTLFEMPMGVLTGRDFLYVKDAAAITTWFLLDEAGKKTNGLFNVGSGIASSWDTIASHIFSALHKPFLIKRIPIPEHLIGKYQYYTKADISKLRRSGCNVPITPLEDAVKDYVKNYLVLDKTIS